MSNEWYTPAKYIEAARQVMGSIDLDPASCALANQTVKATRYYTQADNGLSKVWYGNVWLNPPYGKTIAYESHGRYKGGGNTKPKSLQVLFIHKALAEYRAGNVNQAILLVTANITLTWFQPLWEFPICIPYSRMTFFCPDSKEMLKQVFGNAFVYLGANEQKFVEVFSKRGRIVRAVDVPVRSEYRQLELIG